MHTDIRSFECFFSRYSAQVPEARHSSVMTGFVTLENCYHGERAVTTKEIYGNLLKKPNLLKNVVDSQT